MFVAIWPDDTTRRRLAALPLRAVDGLRPVKPGQWHITLRFLGEVDPVLVPALVGALETAASGLPDSIRGEVGPGTAWFGGDRVLHIPVSGLEAVASVTRESTTAVVPDVNTVGPRFTGHLTVARSSRGRLTPSDRSALDGILFTASFAVESFDLVASRPGAGGHRYTTLARVPLAGGPAASLPTAVPE